MFKAPRGEKIKKNGKKDTEKKQCCTSKGGMRKGKKTQHANGIKNVTRVLTTTGTHEKQPQGGERKWTKVSKTSRGTAHKFWLGLKTKGKTIHTKGPKRERAPKKKMQKKEEKKKVWTVHLTGGVPTRDASKRRRFASQCALNGKVFWEGVGKKTWKRKSTRGRRGCLSIGRHSMGGTKKPCGAKDANAVGQNPARTGGHPNRGTLRDSCGEKHKNLEK